MAQTPKPILSVIPPDQLAEFIESFHALVDSSGGPDACWPWVGGSFDHGYGVLYLPGVKPYRMVKAHRVAFEIVHGYTPLTIDHLCHGHEFCTDLCIHRACCRPTHLAARSLSENVRRGQLGRRRLGPSYGQRKDATHCVHNHEFTPENTWVDSKGSRYCRRCAADSAMRQYRAYHGDGPDKRYRQDGVCANGHDTAVVGLTPDGKCRQCRRDINARNKARQRAAPVR